jgi:hypothetical protein
MLRVNQPLDTTMLNNMLHFVFMTTGFVNQPFHMLFVTSLLSNAQLFTQS